MAEYPNEQRPAYSENGAERSQSNAENSGAPPITWQAPRATVVAGDDAPKSSVYHYKCYDPPSREDADACQQRRSAQASEDQWWISFWGLIASVFAAFFTGWAAFAAASAARYAADAVSEARRSAKISEDALSHQKAVSEIDQRPWLAVTAIVMSDLKFSQKTMSVLIGIKIENVGKIPAYDVWCMAHTGLRTENGADLSLVKKVMEDIEFKAKLVGFIMPGEFRIISRFGCSKFIEEINKNDIFIKHQFVIPHIGCVVNYKTTDRTEFKKTIVIYEVVKIGPSGGQIIVPADGDIPQALVGLNDVGIGMVT